MSGAWVIAWREYRSFFRTALGWMAMALYLLVAGLVFGYGILRPGESASLRDFFGLSGFLLLPVVPAITMRLVSEELKQGTIEPLMASPVSDWSIVAGKYAGACLFLLTVLAPTLVYPVVLWWVSDPRPDPGPIAAGYLSLVLLGGMYVAAGLLVSTLTSSQALAFLGTFLALLALLLMGTDLVELPEWGRAAVSAVAIRPRLSEFAKGVVDTGHVAYFVAATGWLLVLAYVSLESRRWR